MRIETGVKGGHIYRANTLSPDQVGLLVQPEVSIEYKRALEESYRQMLGVAEQVDDTLYSHAVTAVDAPNGGTYGYHTVRTALNASNRHHNGITVEKPVQTAIRDDAIAHNFSLSGDEQVLFPEIFNQFHSKVLIPESFFERGRTIVGILRQLVSSARDRQTLNGKNMAVMMAPTMQRSAEELFPQLNDELQSAGWGTLIAITYALTDFEKNSIPDHGKFNKAVSSLA